MNKKGMTLVEIIVAISLISVVMIFLFQVLFTVINGNKRNNTKSKTLISKAIIMKAVEHDLDTFGLKDNDASSSVLNCHDSIYEEFESGTLNQILPVTARDNDYYCIKFIFNPINVKNNEGYLLFYQNNDKGFLAYKRGVKSGNGFIPESQIVREIDSFPKNDSSNELIKSAIDNDNDIISLKIDIPIIATDGNNYDLALNYIYSSVINNPNPDDPDDPNNPPSDDNNAKIILDLNGGMYEGQTNIEPIKTKIGEEVHLSTPEKNGTKFSGWKIVSGSADINGNTVIPRASMVELKAIYCGTFAEDDWETIAFCVHNRDGDSAPYDVRDEKEVPIEYFSNGMVQGPRDYTVRIANDSNYDCTLDSKTACGFVVEFVDIIVEKQMPYQNDGGWPATKLYKYLNGDTSDHLTYDGTNATLFSKLPPDLQKVIVDTTVVSGHGKTSKNDARTDGNWESRDKLYLLSAGEIWLDGDSNPVSNLDAAYTKTRQLDFYNGLTTTTSANTDRRAVKSLINSFNTKISWWLRTALAEYNYRFLAVSSSGRWSTDYAGEPNLPDSKGVAPAFRIG